MDGSLSTISTAPRPLSRESASAQRLLNSRYVLSSLLGKGAYGKVYLGFDNQTSSWVAVKILKGQSATELRFLEYFGQQDTGYIVKLLASFTHQGRTCLVFEHLAKNLYEVLRDTQFYGLALAHVKVLAWQLLAGLSLLHASKVVHCDLKPENVMLATEGKAGIQIIDFSNASQGRLTGKTQTRFYRAPEVLRDKEYGCEIDMWSCGCLLLELHLGRPVFPGKNTCHQLHKIKRFRVKGGVKAFVEKHSVWREEKRALSLFVDLIERLLRTNPAKRLTAAAALKHPFFIDDKLFVSGIRNVHSRQNSQNSSSKVSTNTSTPQSRLSSCDNEF